MGEGYGGGMGGGIGHLDDEHPRLERPSQLPLERALDTLLGGRGGGVGGEGRGGG